MESLTDVELEELGKEFQDLRERAGRDLERLEAWRQRPSGTSGHRASQRDAGGPELQ